MCQLFAVDMAYCGGEGLVTDKDSALVVMACSPVRNCMVERLNVKRFPLGWMSTNSKSLKRIPDKRSA